MISNQVITDRVITNQVVFKQMVHSGEWLMHSGSNSMDDGKGPADSDQPLVTTDASHMVDQQLVDVSDCDWLIMVS